MVFSNGLKSPREESNFPGYTPPARTIGGQMSSNMPSTVERQSLHRRFTTNAVPTLPTLSSLSPLSPIGQQRRQAAEPQPDITSSVSRLYNCFVGSAKYSVAFLNRIPISSFISGRSDGGYGSGIAPGFFFGGDGWVDPCF
jgi:hypothetical protein